MCIMHKSDEYGVIRLKKKDSITGDVVNDFAGKLMRQMPYNVLTIADALHELIDEGVLVLDGERLYQRRMVRDARLSDTRRDAGRRRGTKRNQSAQQNPSKHDAKCESASEASRPANAENEIASFIKEALHIENVEQRNKNIIPPYEIDIYLPDYKIGIEYNGLVWHSEKFGKDKDYHLNKLNRCNDNDIKLIQIFEDEYIEHKEIIFEKIRHILGKDINKNKIYARKCDVNIIEKKEAMIFLNDNHIQGYNPSTVYLGCFYENKLIAVMTFKEERKGSGLWELNRFASDIHNHCIGVGGKLFKYFIKNYYPIQVKSFADRRWTLSSDDNLYTNLGFTLDKILKPDYSYVTSKGCRVHKFNFRKKNIIHKYKEYNLNMDMTEKEMADIIGVFKIWDCGLYKYIWKR